MSPENYESGIPPEVEPLLQYCPLISAVIDLTHNRNKDSLMRSVQIDDLATQSRELLGEPQSKRLLNWAQEVCLPEGITDNAIFVLTACGYELGGLREEGRKTLEYYIKATIGYDPFLQMVELRTMTHETAKKEGLFRAFNTLLIYGKKLRQDPADPDDPWCTQNLYPESVRPYMDDELRFSKT